jgi:hypothetical protein
MKLNPNNETVQKLDDQYYKLLGLVIHKYDLGEVVITGEDLDKWIKDTDGMPCLYAHDKEDGLHIKVVSEAEGRKLAKEHGGLPT